MLPAAIHDSGRQIVLAVTGGGSGAIAELLTVAGASRTVLEARVPYAYPALVEWLGGPPDNACSEPTARAMAMAAWMRARSLAPETPAEKLLGVGCTASLASDRPKRGDHRMFVAVQSATTTHSWSLVLPDKTGTRAEEEMLATSLIVAAIASHAGVAAPFPLAQSLVESRTDAPREWTELLLGARTTVGEDASASSAPLLFPGAFNPPHAAHRQMAAIAERRTGRRLAYELSIKNVDKPPLDFRTIADRLAMLNADGAGRPVILTAAPTFVEKAALFPGATFVVGADTLARIADPRYTNGSAADRDGAIKQLVVLGTRLLAFGRSADSQFLTLANLNLPPALARLCDEVPEADFREDVSSTELRTQ